MTCIATFFSHFGAVRFQQQCRAQGLSSHMMPVPRALSSSCGTCVRYEGTRSDPPSDEVEQIVEVTDSGFRVLYQAAGC